jgi:nitrous oxide reductase accessory protein NosL
MAKKKKATKKAAESLYDLKEEIVEEVKAPAAPAKPESFKSRKAARAYAKANGGKVVEKGKFYVR